MKVEEEINFMQGNEACAEGAIASGCRFFAFYPITPAGEIAARMSNRLPKLGGIYIQMEDEISSIASVIGASWGGAKAMTATSGPGFSLMQENIGYAVMTETPCVIVNVQRGGPSTGTPAVPMQGDVTQARHGSHGEYEAVVLAPYSVQEMFDLTVEAFNLSERLRTPVILLADELVGHMREEAVIPDPSELALIDRELPGEDYDGKAFLDEEVAPMPIFGRGYHSHVTGSTHDERGRRFVTDPEHISKVVHALYNKIRRHIDEIHRVETQHMDDCEVALFSYGSVARTAWHVVEEARKRGVKAGLIRPISLWPFPSEIIDEAVGQDLRKVIVLENNMGQMVSEVVRAIHGRVEVDFLPPQTLGTIYQPGYVLDYILKEVQR
ncbi:MAG: 2-oxoacid:acceptor oxidoreductase subunit alpha [Nitrososphaeria archaeon]|nr:2-oxoacid:acceptor oxidoreductase subunit alpha [Nitrososphaeria archaeon]NIN52612.1 2-oxoacid:acceptor oxidoreductase subunit alpha [Nitrososphaeria archaeon]NIQ33087.1 2-oxoacid:acceptor oxidoreductase subunit alpha [Nitrososphaeria archaeon]